MTRMQGVQRTCHRNINMYISVDALTPYLNQIKTTGESHRGRSQGRVTFSDVSPVGRTHVREGLSLFL